VKSEWRNNKDFLAGLLFIVVGGLAVVIAGDYPIGSTMRMGPGYFPSVLGGVLVLFGLYVMVRGLRSGEKVKGEWGWRPLGLITLSIVLFGATVERLGLIPALVLVLLVSALAGREFRLKEALVLTVVMGALAVVVFPFGLKLPYPLFPGVLWTF
jgi:uncharacterized membrane protein